MVLIIYTEEECDDGRWHCVFGLRLSYSDGVAHLGDTLLGCHHLIILLQTSIINDIA